MDYLLVVVGLLLLFGGSEGLVRGASGLAQTAKVSPLLIGLVVVGFGTSMPELTTSVSAALNASPAIAAGNVVGSNTANILLILGLSALLAPIRVSPAAFARDGTVLLGATVLASTLLLFTSLGFWGGMILVFLLAAYVGASFYLDRTRPGPTSELHAAEAELTTPATRPLHAIIMAVFGLIALIGGAYLLVTGAVAVARSIGVGEAVIGLSVVAVGTSLPEMAASLAAARKGQGEIAFGNIIGSNIFNLLGILGASALIAPFGVGAGLNPVDIGAMLVATVLMIVFAMTGWKIGRLEGATLIGLYVLFTLWLVMMGRIV
jgi:cation:H+ antiporter